MRVDTAEHAAQFVASWRADASPGRARRAIASAIDGLSTALAIELSYPRRYDPQPTRDALAVLHAALVEVAP